MIVKLVNVNPHVIHVHLNLNGIPDGKGWIEFLQSDDQNAANTMTYNGAPEYRIEPKTIEIEIKDSATDLNLNPNGFYVLVCKR